MESVLVVLSGKRKSGKDFVAGLLSKRLGEDRCQILRLSGPLKKQYALEHNIDFNRLLDSSDYKEIYRSDMIKWGEERRKKDPGYFGRQLIPVAEESKKSVWIVTDARRKTDLKFFKSLDKVVVTVRVSASDEVRESRGWHFKTGIDDAESECDLDDYNQWTFEIVNNGNNDLEIDVDKISKELGILQR